jgi:hypothetical protein
LVAISSDEQTEINDPCHGLIPIVVWEHMVAAIVFWQQPCWSLRIPEHAIKVDHCIEGARRTDPMIHLAAFISFSGGLGGVLNQDAY